MGGREVVAPAGGEGSGKKSSTQALQAVPLPVLRVMKRAMESSPHTRYQSMAAFVQALEHAREEVLEGEPRAEAAREPTVALSFDEQTAPHAPIVGHGAAETQPGLPSLPAEDETGDFAPIEMPTPEPARLPPVQARLPKDPPSTVGSINPSEDGTVSAPKLEAVRPRDPTDQFIAQAIGGPRWGVAIAILSAAIVILASGWFLLSSPALESSAPIREPTVTPDARVAAAAPPRVDDMAGNVWEWTSSAFPGRPNDISIRGGGWGNRAWCLRVSYRHWNPPYIGLDMVGFRCVKDTI